MNNIYSILLTKCPKLDKNNRYLKRYISYILACSLHNVNLKDEIFELHHIAPKDKTLFPQFSDLNLNPWNGVYLTGRQHYRAHYLLAKIYGHRMWNALNLMRRLLDSDFSESYSNNLRFEEIRKNLKEIQSKHFKEHWADENKRKLHIDALNSSWTIERKLTHSIKMSNAWTDERKENQSKNVSGVGNPFYNKSHTQESISKIKSSLSSRIISYETKTKLSESCSGEKNGFYNKSHSEESINKIKKSLNELEPLSCPHCGLESKSRANMKRYHFYNCKFITI